MSPQRAIRDADLRIAAVAAVQHGAITFEQLLAAGLSRSAARDRLRAGRLHSIHRGVYAVGHPGLSLPGTWMASVLACGPGAVLSHRSAAYLWRLLKPIPGPIHVTVPGNGGRRKRKGVTIHRSITLPTSQTTTKANIPVTGPTRTLTDLRRIAPTREYREALRQAEYHRLPLDLPTDRTRSEHESGFLALCRRHRLPPPQVNQALGPYTVDFLWRAERLVVETDSWSAHGGRVAYAEDRERDLWLKLRGFEVVRFTYEQVTGRPKEVATAVRALLAQVRPTPASSA